MFRVTIPRLSRTMPGLRSFSSAPYIKADIAVNAPKPRPLRPRPRTNFRSVDKGDSTLPEKVPTFNSPADAITYLNSLSNAKRSKASLQIRPAMEIFHAYIKNHENIDRHSLQLYTALLRVFTEFPVNETSKILLEIYDDVKQFVTKPNELQNLQTKFVNLLCEQHSRIQRRLEEVNDRSINERVENLQSEIDSALLEIITNSNPMFRLSVESHDLVLGALAARANTEKVNEIFALMAMNKIIPSSDTFSHLVYANGKKDLEAANTWFNRYRSAPIVKTSKPYFAFASVLLENGYFNEAWELLNVTMLGDGIPFGVDALNFILGELSKNGFYEEAKTRYKQVVNEETGDLRAKLKTHMVMLRGAINNNDLDLASSILTQNKNITAIPNVGQLFSMSVEKHALDFALELAKRAIEVEPETLHRLMVGLFHKGLYDQVKEVFTTCQGKFSDEEMMALYKVGKDRSDRSCYEIAIEAMLKTRKEHDVLCANNVAIEAFHRNCVIPRWLLKDISIALAEKGATGDAKNFVELFNPSLEFPLIAIPQVAKALIISILDHGILPAKTEFEKFTNGIQKYIDQLPRIFTDLESVSDQVREIGKLIIAKAEAEDRQSIAKEVELTMENFINAVEAYKQQLKGKLMMEIEERKEKSKEEMEQEMSNLEEEGEAGLELEQQLRETTARIRAIDQALADSREYWRSLPEPLPPFTGDWWRNERDTLQAEKVELLRKENRLDEAVKTSASSAFIAPVEYNPATYSVIDRLQKNGLHLSLIERAQQLQLIRECFGTSQKINVAVLCASRGMGKTALLRALADPERYESRKIPKIARAHKVGRVIPVDLSQMLKIDQPGEIEKYIRDSTLLWVEIIQRHLLLLFHGCTVDGILFKESSKTFIKWCAEFRKLDLLAKEWSRLTKIAFPEADDDCKAAGPVFLLDEIAVFLHETGAFSMNLKDGARLEHTLLSEALGRISAVPGAAVIVAGTKDGRLGLLSQYSQFIAMDVPLTCFSDAGCREYCTAYILKYNQTKQPAHAIPAPDFEDATGILPLMLLHSYNIPRFLAISMELYCEEMSTEPNYKFSYDFHAAVLRAIRRHYQDASLALAHLGTDSLTLLTLACASGYPLNDVDMKIGNIPVRDLVDRCIIFRGIANKYVLPVQMLFDPNSRYQNKVSEQAKEWIPGLDIERCFFHFNKWVNNAIKNTGGIYFEDVILQSLAARIFVFKRLHCQYPNSPNLVAFPEVYDCLPGSDSQQITSSWMIYTNDVSFCADKDIPAPHVPPVSATASGKVYHTKPLPNARFDGALESPIPTYIQAKYSTKIIWTDVAMQIKNLPANGRLLWIMPTINEDYILDFSQLSKNKEVVEGAYATGRLAFVSGSGALSPYTFSAMKLLKYFDVPK